MRILHTSDWHLGQHFMGKTRITEHKAFLDWLLTLVEERQADALVVAGDVFDTGTPPSYARTLYNEFIVSLQGTGCRQLLILGGNHDSDATLNEGRSILSFLNTRVTAGLSDDLRDHVTVLDDRAGNPGLILCTIPFLRPRDLVRSMAGQSGTEKQVAMGQAIREFYDGVFAESLTIREAIAAQGDRLPVMATGHLTVVGGKATESVRDIYIGSLDAFPAAGFPAADYIALGHLHQGQAIKNMPHIRYSGSPIPLSFDEGRQEKQVLMAEFRNGSLADVVPVTIPCFRRLVCLKGNLKDIEAGIRALDEEITAGGDGAWRNEAVWLEAEVAEDDYLTDLQERIQAMIAGTDGQPSGTGIELLRVRRKRKGRKPGMMPENRERLEELNPRDVFSRRLNAESLEAGQADILSTLFDEILEQVRVQGGEDTPEGDAL